MILDLAPSNTIPSNDNNIIDPCVACGEFAACRDGLCPKCDHDVMAHCDEVEHFPYTDDEGEMFVKGYHPGKY